jgi:hypothetical protein
MVAQAIVVSLKAFLSVPTERFTDFNKVNESSGEDFGHGVPKHAC